VAVKLDGKNNEYKMNWDDNRMKKNEVVTLLPEDETEDEANLDRWDYL
jgi:hypothetical protein